LNREGYHSARGKTTAAAAGVDAGATLLKVALRDATGAIDERIFAADAQERAARWLAGAEVGRVGLTGGSAGELSRAIPGAVTVNEFAAWGTGAAALLAEQEAAPPGRYLLVSLGTGTSVLLVDGLSVSRVGGTALGGGTLLGLGAVLAGTSDFERLAALAAAGSRRQVDLLVSDIYRAGEFSLVGEITASNFGKLAPRLAAGESVSPPDMAHALVGLVGENVALVCAGLAAAAQVTRIVFGGTTLRGNPALEEILSAITRALGREPLFLRRGEFAGALGALLLADR
jgi:type II pantothenate kinase